MSSRRLMVALAALIPLTFSAAAYAQSKVGYVNFQKALAELDEATAAAQRASSSEAGALTWITATSGRWAGTAASASPVNGQVTRLMRAFTLGRSTPM